MTDVTAPMLHSNASLRARWQFAVTDLASVVGAQLEVKSGAGFAAWINGAEVARRRAPGALAWNSAATTNRSEAAIAEWETISLTNSLASLGGGTNVLAVQALNDNASDPDFVIRPRLQGIGLRETNLFYLATPSPGAANRADTLGFVGKVTYSAPRGFYTNAFSLALGTDPEEAEIRYTLDGSTPAPTNGAIYDAPLTIASTTVIRTRAFLAGYVPSACSTRTFLFPGDVIRQSPTGAAPGPGWPTSAINGQVVNYGMDPRIVTSASYAAVMDPPTFPASRW